MAEANIDFNEVIESMGRFNEELIKAGVMLAGEGLTGPDEGFVVDFNSDPPVVTDGPYTEAKELFNGFWILDVSSKEEAKQWAKKVPLGKGVKLEVRRVSETEEFPQDNPWIEKEIQWRADLAEKVAEQAARGRRQAARVAIIEIVRRPSQSRRSLPGADPDGSELSAASGEHLDVLRTRVARVAPVWPSDVARIVRVRSLMARRRALEPRLIGHACLRTVAPATSRDPAEPVPPPNL